MENLSWESYFELAKDYFEKNNNLEIPQRYNIKIGNDVINLGKWVSNQRQLY